MKRIGARLTPRTRWAAAALLLVIVTVVGWQWLRAARREPGEPPNRRWASGHTSLQRLGPALERRAPPALRLVADDHAPGFRAVTPSDLGGPGPHFEHYRGRSGRLDATAKPASVDPISKTTSLERGPTLEVWVPRLRVGKEGTAIFARLTDEAQDPSQLVAEISVAELEKKPAAFAPMARDPDDPARFRFDFVPAVDPEATGRQGRDTPAPRHHRFVVVVRGLRDGSPFVREAAGQFLVHAPGASLLAAEAKVARDAGDLALTITADVARAGTYHAFAELWGAGGETAVAFARERLPALTPGRHEIVLRFGGRILRDAGVDGPYVVRNLRLMQVDTHPAQEGEPIPVLPPSPAWPARSFE
ncbi:MAG TPA: hypothetical protein VGG33_29195 [Polyangia bacterium]